MAMFAVKFREKQSKDYVSVVFHAANTEREATKAFEMITKDEMFNFDIDKRTISWSGSSVPLGYSYVVIHASLDNLT